MPAHLITGTHRAGGFSIQRARTRFCGRAVSLASWSSGTVAVIVPTAMLVLYLAGCRAEDTPVAPPSAVPASIVLSSSAVTLRSLSETATLTASVYDQMGRIIRGAATSWTSGDASVATVANDGVVTALANGTTDIAATAGDASATATVTVDQQVAAVGLSPSRDALLAIGDTVRLGAVAGDANGHRVADVSFT